MEKEKLYSSKKLIPANNINGMNLATLVPIMEENNTENNNYSYNKDEILKNITKEQIDEAYLTISNW